MALINFYKGLESDYDFSLHNNSIYQCTDSGVVYILGTKHEKISKEEIDNIVGSNTYTDANYISKETNLTDAALQLDEEIKAINDNLAILNAASVKSIKVGSNTTNETFSSGVITIANATTSTDGALSKEDKTKLDNIETTYVKLTGDSFKNNNACWGGKTTNGDEVCLAYVDTNNNNKFGSWTGGTYIRSNFPQALMLEVGTVGESDSTFYNIYNEGNFKAGVNYVAPSALNNYLPLAGGTMTGAIAFDSTINNPISWGGNGILYTEDDLIFFGTQNKGLILRTSDHAIGIVRNSATYYLWDSYNLDPKQWYISQQTEDYNLTSRNGITYYNNATTSVDNNPGGNYGVVATIGNFDDGSIGTNNTWGFQLAKANDSDYLKFREFTGLTIGEWKELAYKEDAKSLVFTQSAGANETNAANYLKVRDGYFNIVVVHDNNYYTPNEINTSNPDSIIISFSVFTTTGYNIYRVVVTADGTCTESLYTSFTIPTVQTVSEFPTELDNYADGSIFIKE